MSTVKGVYPSTPEYRALANRLEQINSIVSLREQLEAIHDFLLEYAQDTGLAYIFGYGSLMNSHQDINPVWCSEATLPGYRREFGLVMGSRMAGFGGELDEAGRPTGTPGLVLTAQKDADSSIDGALLGIPSKTERIESAFRAFVQREVGVDYDDLIRNGAKRLPEVTLNLPIPHEPDSFTRYQTAMKLVRKNDGTFVPALVAIDNPLSPFSLSNKTYYGHLYTDDGGTRIPKHLIAYGIVAGAGGHSLRENLRRTCTLDYFTSVCESLDDRSIRDPSMEELKREVKHVKAAYDHFLKQEAEAKSRNTVYRADLDPAHSLDNEARQRFKLLFANEDSIGAASFNLRYIQVHVLRELQQKYGAVTVADLPEQFKLWNLGSVEDASPLQRDNLSLSLKNAKKHLGLSPS